MSKISYMSHSQPYLSKIRLEWLQPFLLAAKSSIMQAMPGSNKQAIEANEA